MRVTPQQTIAMMADGMGVDTNGKSMCILRISGTEIHHSLSEATEAHRQDEMWKLQIDQWKNGPKREQIDTAGRWFLQEKHFYG